MGTFKRVLIMAGGTGGHVFPGLAVAEYLRAQVIDVHWLGTSQGLEARLVPDAKIPLHLITIHGLRGKGITSLVTAPWKISKAVVQAYRILKSIKPDVVLGMGGFASGPGGIASWLLRIPLVIHEQNAKAGFTNKMLAPFSKKVLEGFPGAFKPHPKVLITGNPVRIELEKLPSPAVRLDLSRSSFRLLVLGGSLGAQALNEIVPQTLASFKFAERPEIWHQAGEKHFEIAKSHYASLGIQANCVPFIKDMAQAYSWADMVLCRAGALTVSELCVVGLGAIFVPYPFAVDDHQTANAHFMVEEGAALCIQQRDLTENRLADYIRQFMVAPKKRMMMAKAAYGLRQVQVAKKIFDILCLAVNQT